MSGYKQAGVDVAGEGAALGGLLAWVNKTHAHRRVREPGHVAHGAGYFAGVVELGGLLGLAVAADGVGTKLLVAQLCGRYDTVGIDLVAMNVNDLVCVGAEPLTFLDYVAVEALDPAQLAAIGEGLYEGARQAGVTIAGGELAQIGAMLKGVAPGKAFDLAGVAIGKVNLEQVNLGAEVQPGDVVVGWASSGIHSNGLSLARTALLEQAGLGVDDPLPGGAGETVGQALLEPTRIYVEPALRLLAEPKVKVSALAHITGGGFANMGRIAAPCGYVLDELPPIPPVFEAIRAAGSVAATDLHDAYNLGVGFTVTVRPGGQDRALAIAREAGFEAWILGRATADPERRVRLPERGLISGPHGFKEDS
ncbi:MAG: phosphoribosylformylglycinamidine cyclo-ligase [Planctomycetes bacterium]|nr:phosphoribosylformylglycinamidine cyclo-ligase [Planctomycetota bacterium]